MMRTSLAWSALVALTLGSLGATVEERAMDGTGAVRITALEVLPPAIRLDGARDRVRVVVLARRDDGGFVDVTTTARYSVEDPRIASVADGIVRPSAGDHPSADGSTSLIVRAGDASKVVPIEVRAGADPVRFGTETLAVLTRQGCNSGACHGSPSGKGGFSLSLFAFDPDQDLRTLTRDALARRTNPIEPDESLLLKKPLLRVPHVGGKRLHRDSDPYATLRAWIDEGCRPDDRDSARLTGVAVEPGVGLRRLEDGTTQQLRVVATFADGRVRDVTHLTAFESTDHGVAEVDADGLVTAKQAGDVTLTVRYLDRIATAAMTFKRHDPEFAWPAATDPAARERNRVDQLVNAKLRQREIVPAGPCSDAVFVRRVHLDLTGLLPTVAELDAFLADTSATRRDALIDRLLASDAHARFWARKLADLLKVTRQTLKDRAPEYAAWLEQAYRDNLPVDTLARELLTGSGAPALYYEATPAATDLVETTTQVFLGSRLGCAKCHNHPFESWTQDDYFRIAAAFVPGTQHPRREREMTPWPWDEGDDVPMAAGERHRAFATWLSAPDNPWFARVAVNRIWSELFGRGIVDPVDDFRASNPPSNPELLDALAEVLVSNGFDRRPVLRMILESATYQRSSTPADLDDDDPGLFAHHRPRLLTAEQVRDAVLRVASEPQREAAVEAFERADAAAVENERTLAAQFPRWLAAQRDALASGAMPSASAWSVGPTFAGGFKRRHAPESRAVGAATPDAEIWTERPELTDGTAHTLDIPAGASIYLRRVIEVPTAQRATILLGSDDGMKLFVDGQEVIARDVARGVAADQDRISVDLHAGRNEVLLRIHNRGGAAGFYFRTELPLLDAELVALFRAPDEQLTDAQRAELAQRHAAESLGRADIERARADASRVIADWFATQSIVPVGEPRADERALMSAFGIPERSTACACERLSEPTLQHALQVMNGEFFAARRAEAVRNLPQDDDALIVQLWRAALARLPEASERTEAIRFLGEATDRNAAVDDLVWALLATREFLFQH